MSRAKSNTKLRDSISQLTRVGQGGSGIPVYPKKIPPNTQNSSKYTQN